MKRNMLFLSGCSLMLLFILSGCVQRQQILAAPTLLPGTDRNMLTAGYWISRHPSPDTLILTTEQIAELNRQIETDMHTVVDISRVSLPNSGRDIAENMLQDIDRLRSKARYLASGSLVSGSFYERIAEDMNMNAIGPEVNPGYGVVVCFSDQRILPTLEPLYSNPFEVDFDNLQNNTIELATPVLLLHWTKDLKWTYVRSSVSSGWVESRHIARCSAESLMDFIHPDRFVVILRPKADIYRNPLLTYSEEYVQMGVRLPLIESEDNAYQVMIPIRDSQGYLVKQQGYVLKNQACEGYLPYTARNVLQQAFDMLNAPYGWGGMYGEQDCSRYIQQLFATVGVTLPRNSADQSKVGGLVAEFVPDTAESIKISSLDRAVGGITTLYTQGHIMLYLGKVGLLPYAIHETWAFRMRNGDQDSTYKVNRVAVTDLDLGIGTRNGSLLDRLKSVRIIQ
jgi:hypothetical protein